MDSKSENEDAPPILVNAIREIFRPRVVVEKSHLSPEHLRSYVIPEPSSGGDVDLNAACDQYLDEVFVEHGDFARDSLDGLKVQNIPHLDR